MTKIEMMLVVFLAVPLGLLAAMLVAFLLGHTPSRAAVSSYMERCVAVGFTAEQCRFMHGG